MPVWLIPLLIGIALQVAGNIVSSMARKDAKSASGVRSTLEAGGDLSPRIIVGRYGSHGQLRYAGTWGNSGDTPNAYLSRVIEVSCLPIRGYSGWIVNGERVTLAATKTGNLGFAVLAYRVKGKDHMWINPYLGDQVAPDPLMLAKFGGDHDRPYAGMIGRGCGYFVVTALVNRELFPGVPEIVAEVDGIALDDPRGDGQQENPIVAAYTLLKGLRYGGEWVWGPQGITAVSFRADNLKAEADKCDEPRAKAGGGTEKRFRIGLDISLDEEPHAIVDELLKGCSGRWADLGGVYRFLVGAPAAPVLSFTDDDLAISAEQTFEPFPGLETLCNAMTATYPDPTVAWEMTEAPPRYSSTLEAEDDGRRLPLSTAFRAVPYPVQVQELMRSAVEDARRFRRHSFTAPPEWWEFEVLDAVAWTSDRNGYAGKSLLISMIEDLPNASQFVALQEIDAADYDWSVSDQLPSDVAPLVIARPAPHVTTGIAVAPYTVQDASSAARRAAIEVMWDAGLVDVRDVRIQVRETWAAMAIIADATVSYDADDVAPSRVVANPAILSSTAYEVRAIYLPFSGRVTRWSNQDVDGTEGPWLTVTTPEVPDIDVPPIEVTMLGNELAAAHGYLTGTSASSLAAQLEAERERAEALALAQLDAMATARERIDILTVQKDGAIAGVIETQKAVVETNAAMAELATQVIASIADNLADGYVSMKAEVDPAASTATVLIGARATKDVTAEAKLLIKAAVDGLGGTTAQVGVMGAFYVFPNKDAPGVAALTVDANGLMFETARFRRLESKKRNPDGSPIIVIDGDTGAFSITVA